MKSLMTALLLGGVAAEQLFSEPSIWDESIQVNYNVCDDPQARWKDKSNSMKTFKRALRKKKKFVDKDFSATMQSVYSSEAPPRESDAKRFNDSIKTWARLEEFYPGEKVQLFGSLEEFSPHGINQGGLGDCWFLAAAASLAEHPERMHQLFHPNSRKEAVDQGIYRFYFWSVNKWIPINIDDRLPAGKWGERVYPIMSQRSDFGAWWMPLFEKAYAKFMGNYDRIQGGWGFESFRQLTNKPVFWFSHSDIKNETEFSDALHKWAVAKYDMTVSCCHQRGTGPDGLITGHLYTLLDIVEVQGTKLAKIRNPWASEHYNGTWSDEDPRWTPELLKEVGHDKANDGIFFMPFSNYLKAPYFRRTDVVIWKEFTKKRNLYNVVQTKNNQYFRITIPKTQVVYFTLEVQSWRLKKRCTVNNTPRYHIWTTFTKGAEPSNEVVLDTVQIYGIRAFGTIGKPDHALEKGDYVLKVTHQDCNASGCQYDMKYTLQVYQEGKGKIKVQKF